MNRETAERIIRLLDQIRPLIAQLEPLLHDVEDFDPHSGVALDRLEISVRAYNCLQRAGVRTVRDIRDMKNRDLLRLPNLGPKTLKEIREAVAEQRWSEP